MMKLLADISNWHGYAAGWQPRIQGIEEGSVPNWYARAKGISAMARPLAEAALILGRTALGLGDQPRMFGFRRAARSCFDDPLGRPQQR